MRARAQAIDTTIEDRIPNRHWFILQTGAEGIQIVDSRDVFVGSITGEISTPDDLPRAQLIVRAPKMAIEIQCALYTIGALRYWLPQDVLPEINALLTHLENTLHAATGERNEVGEAQSESSAREAIHNAYLRWLEAALVEAAAEQEYSKRMKQRQERVETDMPIRDRQTNDEHRYDLCI